MTKVLKFKDCFKGLFLGLMLLVITANSAECALVNIGAEYNHNEYLQYCSPAKYKAMYEAAASDCWSCNIIDAMFDGFKGVIVILTEKLAPLCRIILTLGGAIWLAMYLLKSLGSFAVQNPGKVLDGLTVFLFKIAFVYVVVMAGIDDIVDMVINPLLSIGMDIGKQFSGWAGSAFY